MKTEEVEAMGLSDHLRTLLKFFRLTEVFAAMAFLVWTFSRLPLILRVSSDYISQISVKPNGRLCSDLELEEIAYEDKEVISEVSSTTAAAFTEEIEDFSSGSEKLKLAWSEFGGGEFGRAEGEELSNKEFERRIDAFIARELRFRWEESGAVVLPTGSCLRG
ncbi:hypothetical protein SDJN02_03711, partial [Cucurbita argyrosperma subsp. argyrosperma]